MGKYLSIIVSLVVLFAAISAPAQEKTLEGSITLSPTFVNVQGNGAKFNEYRDVRDGLYSRIRLKLDTDRYFLNFKADDIGYDTQEYRLEGGIWGTFRGYMFYDEIPHNINFNAKTFYSGAGSGGISYTTHPPSTDTSGWNRFDYSTERKTYGGGFRGDLLKPFYFNFSASREERDGIKPTGVAATSPGGIAVELPEPIDYTTDTVNAEFGYSLNPFLLSLNYSYSQFDNDQEKLFFRNPGSAAQPNTDILTLPPDNQYHKLSFKGAVRLPLKSKFNFNFGISRATSDFNLDSNYVSSALQAISLSDGKFDGEVTRQNYDLAFTSQFLPFVDTKLYFKHYKTDNDNDRITTIDDTDVLRNPRFDYRKEVAGLQLGLRLPLALYLNSGYQYAYTKRDREDIPNNDDHFVTADLIWNGLDFMTAKVGYEGLFRRENFEAPNVAPDDPAIIQTWVRRFDAAGKDQNVAKFALDASPLETVDLGLEYRYRNTKYRDVTLGLEKERSNELNLSAGVHPWEFLKLFGYLAFEWIKQDQLQRQLSVSATSGFDPALPPTPTAFNWDVTQKDREFDYGIRAEVSPINRVTFILQHDYVRSNGSADLTYFLGANPLPAGRTQDNIDLSDWDDYRTRTYLIKGIFQATKRFAFSAGYAYEKLTYDDAQLSGYQFVPATSGTNGAFLTGAFRKLSYSSSIFFGGVTYSF